MTNREVFETVKEHLLKQGKRSVGKSGKCAYRGEKGEKCAIGALIPDGVYLPAMEDKAVRSLIKYFPSVAKVFEGVKVDLLVVLQQLHDNCRPEFWSKNIGLIEDKFFEEWRNIP